MEQMMKTEILTICIPTYNRVEFLKRNLKKLIEMIGQLCIQEKVRILISDNCSPDSTAQEVARIKEEQPDIKITYIRQVKNVGPKENTLGLFEKVETPYMMLLGDDDYISLEYLEQVLFVVESRGVSCVIPSYVNITEDGGIMDRGRDIGQESRFYEKGFKNCLENSWRGHQISGLVFKREKLEKKYREKKIDNYYLQIFAVAECCLNGETYHLTEYPVQVTRPPQKKKTWGYGKDGLIGDVFANYAVLDGISTYQRYRLEMKFLKVQYWRYAMYLKKGVREFFGCIKEIASSDNTSSVTKIMFPLSMPFILCGKAMGLLVTGRLFKTLKIKVDI